jgi:hypothetical protein
MERDVELATETAIEKVERGSRCDAGDERQRAQPCRGVVPEMQDLGRDDTEPSFCGDCCCRGQLGLQWLA